MIAVIGGSGLTQLANLEITSRKIVRTPFGEPSGPLTYGRIGKQEVVFLARHGYGHTLAPHEINYRANLWAIEAQKVTRVISVCTVGGIARNLGAGTIAIPDQIIDYTWEAVDLLRRCGQPVTHIDFTSPTTAAADRFGARRGVAQSMAEPTRPPRPTPRDRPRSIASSAMALRSSE